MTRRDAEAILGISGTTQTRRAVRPSLATGDRTCVYRGWALASAGKAVEGLALAEEGISFLERSGGRIFLSRVYGTIAEIYPILGRYADGLEAGGGSAAHRVRYWRVVLPASAVPNSRKID